MGKRKEWDAASSPPRWRPRSSRDVGGIAQSPPAAQPPVPLPPQTTSSECPFWSGWSRWRSGWLTWQPPGRLPAAVRTRLQSRYLREEGGLGGEPWRVSLENLALLWDSPVPPVPSLLLPDVTLRQEWLFWAPSWHDRLQTISDLKQGWGVGGEGEGGGGDGEPGGLALVGPGL